MSASGQHLFAQGLDLGVGPVTSDTSQSIVQKFNKSRSNHLRHAVKNLKRFEAKVAAMLRRKAELLDELNKSNDAEAEPSPPSEVLLPIQSKEKVLQAKATEVAEVDTVKGAIKKWKELRDITGKKLSEAVTRDLVDNYKAKLTEAVKTFGEDIFELIFVWHLAKKQGGGNQVGGDPGIITVKSIEEFIDNMLSPSMDNFVSIDDNMQSEKERALLQIIGSRLKAISPFSSGENDFKEKMKTFSKFSWWNYLKKDLAFEKELDLKEKWSPATFQMMRQVLTQLQTCDGWDSNVVEWYRVTINNTLNDTALNWGGLNDIYAGIEKQSFDIRLLAFRAVVHHIWLTKTINAPITQVTTTIHIQRVPPPDQKRVETEIQKWKNHNQIVDVIAETKLLMNDNDNGSALDKLISTHGTHFVSLLCILYITASKQIEKLQQNDLWKQLAVQIQNLFTLLLSPQSTILTDVTNVKNALVVALKNEHLMLIARRVIDILPFAVSKAEFDGKIKLLEQQGWGIIFDGPKGDVLAVKPEGWNNVEKVWVLLNRDSRWSEEVKNWYKIYVWQNKKTDWITFNNFKILKDDMQTKYLALRAIVWYLIIKPDEGAAPVVEEGAAPVEGAAGVDPAAANVPRHALPVPPQDPHQEAFNLSEEEELLSTVQQGGREYREVMGSLQKLQGEINGMKSDYEIALRTFKSGVGDSLTEDEEVEQLVKNTAALFADLQSEKRNLVEAQKSLDDQLDMVRKSAPAKDFRANYRFTNKAHREKFFDENGKAVVDANDYRSKVLKNGAMVDISNNKFFDDIAIAPNKSEDAAADTRTVTVPILSSSMGDLVNYALGITFDGANTGGALQQRLSHLMRLMHYDDAIMVGGGRYDSELRELNSKKRRLDSELLDLREQIRIAAPTDRTALSKNKSQKDADLADVKDDIEALTRAERERKYDRLGYDGYGRKDGRSGEDGRRRADRVSNVGDLMRFYAMGTGQSLTVEKFKTMIQKDQNEVSAILSKQSNKELIEKLKKSPEGLQHYGAFSTFIRRLNDANTHLQSIDWVNSMNSKSLETAPPPEFIKFIEDITAVNDMKSRFLKSTVQPVPVLDANGTPKKDGSGNAVFTEKTVLLPDLQLDYGIDMPTEKNSDVVLPSTPVVPTGDIDKGVFTRILEMYRSAKPEDKRKAGERVVDIIDSTPSLNPKRAVGLTLIDRTVFGVLSLAVRAAALRGMAEFVKRDIVKTLRGAIIVYALLYTLLILLLFAAVTLDDSVLRIVFNYLNPHSNTGGVVLHLLVLWMLVLVVVSVLLAEHATLRTAPHVSLSTADKTDVTQNAAAITFFAWFVTTFQIAVI